MRCPWMYGDKVKQCAAVAGLVVLSQGEIERFCECENYTNCPVYKERKNRHGLISLKSYYLIYLRFKPNSNEDKYILPRRVQSM